MIAINQTDFEIQPKDQKKKTENARLWQDSENGMLEFFSRFEEKRGRNFLINIGVNIKLL